MSSAVNRPTDVKTKEKDVNAKLQLFGIYSAFANGKVPSNKQIDVAMNSVLESKPLTAPSKDLSHEGKQLVGDLRDVIEKAKLLILSKNEGNLLQDFIWQSQQLTGGDFKTPDAPVDKDTAKQHGNEAVEGLRTLGTLLITNGQFRKLLSDASILLRDIAGDAATNAASRVNPSEDQLAQIDRPAEDNTWHDVPDVQAMKGDLQEKYGSKVPFGKKEDAEKAAEQAAQAGQRQDGSVDPKTTANAATAQLTQNMSEEDKEQAKKMGRDARDATKSYLQEKMPKERREQTIWRLKKMVVEIQGHQDYLQAIDTLLRLAEIYGDHSKNVADQSGGAVKGAHTDDSLKKAEADLKTLIERFANGTSLDELVDSIKAVYEAADKDPELKNWFKRVNTYIRKCLKEQGYILQDAAKDEWDEIYEKGRFLLRERYRGHTDRVVDEIKFVGNQFDHDPQNKAFSIAVQKLFQDLGNDESGKPTFKPHLVKDLRDVILPAIFENVRYVPIPRIEVSDKMMDIVVENLVIESDNLAPNVMEFGSDNYWRWGRKKIANKNKNKLMLSVSGVQMDLRDVSYYIKKKEGFPSVTDRGVFDLFMGGAGFSFKIEMETADPKDKNHYFKVDKVSVDVKNLKINLKQSNHKLLFNLFKPLLFKVVQPAVEKVLEKQLKDSATKADAFAYRVAEEAKKAELAAKRDPSPENVKNMYQRYAEAFQKELAQGKQKADNVASDTKVNMAMTQHDSLFKDIKLPGGISTKATEYKDLAAKGEKWESPVFGIGSAKSTASLPSAPNIIRKSRHTHTTTTSTTGATNGFNKEVSRAFDGSNTAGYHLNGVTNGVHNEKTTLGQNNPVLQGTV